MPKLPAQGFKQSLDRVMANLAIYGILLGSLFAILNHSEIFPFSDYPMYSHVSHLPFTLNQIFAVVAEDSGERETLFNKAIFLFPFDERTLNGSVSRILKEKGRAAAEAALLEELKVYNDRVTIHGGAPLAALRLYAVSVERTSSGQVAPHGRKLLAEAVLN